MMVTSRGFCYLMLIGVVLFSLSYTGRPVFLWLSMILLLIPLFSGLQLAWSLSGISWQQELLQNPVTRQNQAKLQLTLRQKRKQVIGLIDLQIERISDLHHRRALRRQTVLLPQALIRQQITIACPHRGRYRVGLCCLRARDLFGLFYLPIARRKTLARRKLDLWVLPRPFDLEKMQDLANIPKLKQQQISHEFGDEVDAVANLRGFQPGDSMKRIHWNLTARLREIMIKEFEKPMQQEALLLLDIDAAWLDRDETVAYFDHFTDFSAGLARHLLNQGNPVLSLWYDAKGRQAVRAKNLEEFPKILSQHTELAMAGSWSLAQILKEERRQNPQPWTLYWLSNRIDETRIQDLLQFFNRSDTVRLFLLPTENRRQAIRQQHLNRLSENGIEVLLLTVDDLADATLGVERKEKEALP